MTLHHAEYVCARDCGYEVSVGSGVPSAVDRMAPSECPTCGAGLTRP